MWRVAGGPGGRWSLYRDTYVNGINAHGAPMRVLLDVAINGGPPRPWLANGARPIVAPGKPWEVTLTAILTPTETAGMFKGTGTLACEVSTPDGWAAAECDAQVAIWHQPIEFGVASTIYSVPFSCFTP